MEAFQLQNILSRIHPHKKVNLKLFCQKNQDYSEMPFFLPKEKAEVSGSFLFDKRSGNVHLFPQDIEECKIVDDEIQNLRKGISEMFYLIGELPEGCKFLKSTGKVNTAPAFNNTDYYSYKKIFSFLRVRNDQLNRNYDLIFNRFYQKETPEEIEVGCCLTSLQYQVTEIGKEQTKYPESLEDSCSSDQTMGKNYYYNPQINFYADIDLITEDFLTFIKEDIKKSD